MIEPNFHTKKEEQTDNFGRFILEPLPQSFGHSLGNALRRALLSSLEGAAITRVKFGTSIHLFSTIKGVKESVLDIVLNLKKVRFDTSSSGSFTVKLETNGTGKVYAKDLKGDAKVVTEDIYIANITDAKGKLEIEAVVETGVGTQFTEDQEQPEAGFINVDAFFSPVLKVNFRVEEARVGRKINFDRLIMEIWTDGSKTPEEALKQAAGILSQHFNFILSGRDVPQEKTEQAKDDEAQDVDPKLQEIIIDELNLPSRVINALLRENVETVADVIKVGKEKLIKVKGLGKKSFVLIEDELRKMGIEL